MEMVWGPKETSQQGSQGRNLGRAALFQGAGPCWPEGATPCGQGQDLEAPQLRSCLQSAATPALLPRPGPLP